MAVVHATATRDAFVNAVGALLDADTDPGYIEFQTSGDAEVATLTLAATAIGSPSTGVGTFGSITADEDATGGTIAKARFFDGADNLVMTCSVTAADGGGDIELNSVIISAGQTVSITSMTYTAPA